MDIYMFEDISDLESDGWGHDVADEETDIEEEVFEDIDIEELDLEQWAAGGGEQHARPALNPIRALLETARAFLGRR